MGYGLGLWAGFGGEMGGVGLLGASLGEHHESSLSLQQTGSFLALGIIIFLSKRLCEDTVHVPGAHPRLAL